MFLLQTYKNYILFVKYSAMEFTLPQSCKTIINTIIDTEMILMCLNNQLFRESLEDNMLSEDTQIVPR